jgi:hypothetical protein
MAAPSRLARSSNGRPVSSRPAYRPKGRATSCPWTTAFAVVGWAVVPENSIRPDSRGEAESGHHPIRCLPSSTCLEPSGY